jgi:hypothetical protein
MSFRLAGKFMSKSFLQGSKLSSGSGIGKLAIGKANYSTSHVLNRFQSIKNALPDFK